MKKQKQVIFSSELSDDTDVIEILITEGCLRSFLGHQLLHHVLGAYDITFGDVQELATEKNIVDAICQHLEKASSTQRRTYWRHLNEPGATSIDKLQKREKPGKTLWWIKVIRWIINGQYGEETRN